MDKQLFINLEKGGTEALTTYLDNGGDPYATDHRTQATLLHLACGIGNLDLCRRLEIAGLHFAAKDNKGRTPYAYCTIGLAVKRKAANGNISHEDVEKFKNTLHHSYREEDCGIPKEIFFGVAA